ncbi:glucosyl transferase [Escherichia fergusonii]|nr:glucosyl transferase [Escherichia fergusonii]
MFRMLYGKSGFVCFFLFSAFIMLMRRPDIITAPIPWAEDGKVWLSQAYNIGFASLFLVQDGYMQTISRVAYFIGSLFGLADAPLVATLIAISLRCLMCSFFMSKRFDFIDLKVRFSLLIFFLLMPNIYEGYVNITNAQWYLSLYAIGILVSRPPTSNPWKAHDIIILVLSGLSGPFVLFLVPCIFFKYFIKAIKDKCIKPLINHETFIVTLCFVIQTIALLSGFDGRSKAPLGASLTLLADIFAMRVLFGTFIDNKFIEFITNFHYTNLLLLISYSTFLLFAFLKGDWRVRSLISFTVLMLGSSLYRPMMSLHSEQWLMFIKPGAGERYFFIINFMFFCSIAYIMSILIKGNNNAIALLLLMLCIPSIYAFKIYEVPGPNFKEEILKYEKAVPGDNVSIRIAPPGWSMNIIKR